ncbi:metallophosphoesterase [Alkaliphilus serpentinus]|uniref:Metallophosphoesterase n=1 Tax=Alkaliphilus serpentinus TaxID=1482731 RepID=A0A833HLK9_9FIRM|nr:metallophosphoesterase [Alkaliphilus serpentinus]KAB3525893.1 metallophosphoesterase [Alkaliphilus serpentinus]
MRKNTRKTKLLRWIGIIIVLVGFCTWQNNSIVVSNYIYHNSKIPSNFNNYKIVHISDLHNKIFGEEQSKLLKEIENLSPDMIIVTGDLIDRRKFHLETAMDFIKGAVEIAPTFYVSGNHEAWLGQYDKIKQQLKESGVYIMDDTAYDLTKGRSTIQLLGLSDPDFYTESYQEGTNTSNLEEQLKKLPDSNKFTLLLSHRPELFDLYWEHNIDLIFTGHAHGGQIRLPFIGGLVAPDQGLFPKYTKGRYHKGSSTMYVSRGLGNSIIPVRIFNRPEIVTVTLKNTE